MASRSPRRGRERERCAPTIVGGLALREGWESFIVPVLLVRALGHELRSTRPQNPRLRPGIRQASKYFAIVSSCMFDVPS